MQDGPAGCMYSVSDSGWMESANFLQWFEKLFLPSVRHLTSTAPVILFFDGHHSHMSIHLVELARSSNVHLFCLPPHTTHLLQPLDVAVFGPVKNAWRIVLKKNIKLQQLYVHVSHCNDGDNKTTARDAHDSQQSEGGNSHLS